MRSTEAAVLFAVFKDDLDVFTASTIVRLCVEHSEGCSFHKAFNYHPCSLLQELITTTVSTNNGKLLRSSGKVTFVSVSS